ncbi:MAG: sigma-E factor negative regulatory protein [Steroidobacteraceae bacterium]|jgi:sigma-E factor negative regulatory protein RseA
MSEQIREQVSAFLDGELPSSETELLLKRLTRDAELRESFGRYCLIGESLRGGTDTRLTHGFTARVNRAIDGEPLVVAAQTPRGRSTRWWRPFAGAAVAAGVAAVAVVALQQRAIAPTLRSGLPATAQNMVSAQNGAPTQQAFPPAKSTEALSYTVPAAVSETPTAMPAARLTNYVFAHSKYSAVMGQNDVLNDLLSDADADDAAAAAGSRDARVAP